MTTPVAEAQESDDTGSETQGSADAPPAETVDQRHAEADAAIASGDDGNFTGEVERRGHHVLFSSAVLVPLCEENIQFGERLGGSSLVAAR